MPRSVAILSLGTRKDATTWEKGCRGLGFDLGRVIKKGHPTLDELRAFFAQPADWIFLADHFGGLTLLNEPEDVTVRFRRASVTVRVAKSTEVLTIKDKGFRLQESCELVLWGGCSVCSGRETVETLRALFGPHVLLGFAGLTGWRVVDAMLGGGFIKKGHFFERVAGHVDDPKAVCDAWMRTAKAGYGGGDMEDRFRCVDPDGQEFELRKGQISRGRKFS